MASLNELPWVSAAVALVIIKGFDSFVNNVRKKSTEEEKKIADEADRSASLKASSAKDMVTQGKNFVEGGADDNPAILFLIIIGPMLCNLLAYLTSADMKKALGDAEPHLSTLVTFCKADISQCGANVLSASYLLPSMEGCQFLAAFMGVALVLELLPGLVQTGPETLTGHVPKYCDNGVKFCLVFTGLYFWGSNLGYCDWYDFGIMFDIFPSMLITLNVFGIVFCSLLTIKGLTFPTLAPLDPLSETLFGGQSCTQGSWDST